MKKTFKFLRSGKSWIIAAIIAGFLMACGVLVYARSGFQQHERSYSTAQYKGALTTSEWDLLMTKIDGLVRIASN